ncbi:MAG: AI-2E family transporter [Buchananella hordeovulneris]|nr:AI-2E family transporter [Buchananella hordeovulneris]
MNGSLFSRLRPSKILRPTRTAAQLSQDPVPVRGEFKHNGNPDESVSWGLRVASAWSIRALTFLAGLLVLGWGISKISVIIIPLTVAMLLTALMEPFARMLRKRAHFSPGLAALGAVLLLLGSVVGLMTVAGAQIANDFGQVADRAEAGFYQLLDWMRKDPFGIDSGQLTTYLVEIWHQVQAFFKNNSSSIASGALTGVSSITNFTAGAAIALFLMFFFLKEGRSIWFWILLLLPDGARHTANEAGIRGWVTLGAYARTQVLVALVDAVGIAIGAFFLGIPMWLPIGILVFVGSFIPMVGAFFTGAIAVLVALVDQGPTTALIMMLIVLAVQNIEGNLLQPFLMGNAVSLHPVAVLLAVAAGTYLWGIVGALFVVPVVAFLNTSLMYLGGYDKFPALRDDPDRPGGPASDLDEYLAAPFRTGGKSEAKGPKTRNHSADQSAKRAAPEPEEELADVAAAPSSESTPERDEPAEG